MATHSRYSFLENPRDRGARWAAVYGVAQSQTWLKRQQQQQSLSCVWLFCDTMDGSRPGSSVHGIFQARILDWVAISFSRGSSWPKDQTYLSCIGRWILYHWATREAWLCHTHYHIIYYIILMDIIYLLPLTKAYAQKGMDILFLTPKTCNSAWCIECIQ